jgi:hypothetical protein
MTSATPKDGDFAHWVDENRGAQVRAREKFPIPPPSCIPRPCMLKPDGKIEEVLLGPQTDTRIS